MRKFILLTLLLSALLLNGCMTQSVTDNSGGGDTGDSSDTSDTGDQADSNQDSSGQDGDTSGDTGNSETGDAPKPAEPDANNDGNTSGDTSNTETGDVPEPAKPDNNGDGTDTTNTETGDTPEPVESDTENDQDDGSNETDTSNSGTSDVPDDSSKCPNPAVVGTLSFSHNVTQNYAGNNLNSKSTGSIQLTVGEKGISGSGKGSVALSGTMPAGGCTMSGTNNIEVAVLGTCVKGEMHLNIIENYTGGSMTTSCRSNSGTAPIPPTTNSHELYLPYKEGARTTRPFEGEAGSGTYTWIYNGAF